jgi:hypothetical protein
MNYQLLLNRNKVHREMPMLSISVALSYDMSFIDTFTSHGGVSDFLPLTTFQFMLSSAGLLSLAATD